MKQMISEFNNLKKRILSRYNTFNALKKDKAEYNQNKSIINAVLKEYKMLIKEIYNDKKN